MPEAALPPQATPPVRHVFVYGTLRRGDDNDITQLAPAPTFVGTAAIAGVMHHLGAYPGVVLGQGGGIMGTMSTMAGHVADRVVGEVYAIEPALERVLDEIEGLYPQPRDEYVKRYIPVQLDGQQGGQANATSLLCLVYEINPTYAAGKPVIASGDWVVDRGQGVLVDHQG